MTEFYPRLLRFYAVFVLDTGLHVFVWVGKEATSHEKGGGLVIAHVSHTHSETIRPCNLVLLLRDMLKSSAQCGGIVYFPAGVCED